MGWIYHLKKNDEVVYVGKTTYSVKSRLADHKKEKDFDCYEFFEFDDCELERIEQEHFERYKPKYNKSIPARKNSFMTTFKISNELKPVIAEYIEGVITPFMVNAQSKYYTSDDADMVIDLIKNILKADMESRNDKEVK